MGDMVENGIKAGRIVSFGTLEATNQAIQKGSRSVGGKKYEKDSSTIVVGQQARSRFEYCRALKREIEKTTQDKSIIVQNVDRGGSSSHTDMQTSG
ncbi:hypothetical protein T459_18966 [Capsicum annuum]|uniref:Uncharacterized protein n=1 Tax=Capsicum annuum TaxID=4072 RepID=A0A2G2Z0E6_CAPAN|nr:hypothetical protein T459_18966 [Capsicum annuum]